MKPQLHLRRKFATIITILALTHAQVVFACASTGLAASHSCCPNKVESHAGHQLGGDENGSECNCGQPLTADVDRLVKTKSDISFTQDQKNKWNLPFAASLSRDGFPLFSRTKPLFDINQDDQRPGTPTYLITRRLRI